jgi:hypothetical protein
MFGRKKILRVTMSEEGNKFVTGIIGETIGSCRAEMEPSTGRITVTGDERCRKAFLENKLGADF